MAKKEVKPVVKSNKPAAPAPKAAPAKPAPKKK